MIDDIKSLAASALAMAQESFKNDPDSDLMPSFVSLGQDNKISIVAVPYFDEDTAVHDLGKPAECAFAFHGNEDGDDQYYKNRLDIVNEWAKPENQELIKTLLGRDPVAAEGSFMDNIMMSISATRRIIEQ